MTNAIGAGVILEHASRDSFCFHIRMMKLFGNEMPSLIEQIRVFHGEFVNISEPRFARPVLLNGSN